MIMRSIKSTFGSLIIRLYCHSCKFFIPSSGTHLYCLVKVPVRKFFLQVHCCIGTANGRNSNLYLYLFYIAEGEDAFYGCYFQLVPGFRRIIIVGCKLLYLLVALQHKIDFPGRAPPPYVAIAFYCIVVYFTDIAIIGIRAVPFAQVNQYRSRLAFGVCITMEAYPVCCRQFRSDIIAIEK